MALLTPITQTFRSVGSQPTSSDALLIRPARPTDAPMIYAFIGELEQTLPDPTRFRTVFVHNLSDAAVSYFVAEWAGEVAGFVSCHIQYLLHHGGKIAEIQELYVSPDYRNRHIGQRLLETVTAVAIGEGCLNLEVTTNQQRADAIRFYERESFQRSHYKLVKPLKS